MGTDCYALVRGSAIRVTGLGRKGSVPEPFHYAVSKSVAKVQINEVTTSGADEMLGSEQEDNDNRLRLVRPEQMLNYTVDIDFLRVDPGILSLITGVPLVRKNLGGGFGKTSFGGASFGGGEDDEEVEGGEEGGGLGFGGDDFGGAPFGDESEGGEFAIPPLVVGFDSTTRLPPVSFALEVWSKLGNEACSNIEVGFDEWGFDEGPFGGIAPQKRYGYTVFPYLKGGRLTGFEFKNGLVSFSIRGAQTRRMPRWGVGPYDLDGPGVRLTQPVSRNTLFRQMLTIGLPPTELDGIQEGSDIIEGGTASVTTEDILEGGTAASTTDDIVEGGLAV